MQLLFVSLWLCCLTVCCLASGDTGCCSKASVPHEGYWYELVDCQKTWREARSYCRQSMRNPRGQRVGGGDLLWIENDAENNWIHYVIDNVWGYQHRYATWILYSAQNYQNNGCPNRNRWYWPGKSSSYSKWQQTYPQCEWQTPTRCSYLSGGSNNEWEDMPCQFRLKYVCKRKIPNYFPGDNDNVAFDLGP